MRSILLVTSSPRGEASYSNRVARALLDRLTAGDPAANVVVRDLAAEPLPHIGGEFLGSLAAPPEGRTAAQAAALALSDRLIGEITAAGTIVIASAMINFGIASTLKTWFDYVLRAGVTFAYVGGKPHGLVTGKKVYLAQARGGIYSDGPLQAANFQEPHLRTLLGFIGLTDVEAIAVEGVAFGPEVAEKAYASALDRVSAVTAKAA